jgi:hypothetical protein
MGVDEEAELLEERLYLALRSSAGKGGVADSEASIEALWRQVKARWIAKVAIGSLRAVEQAFPNRATDALPYYEELFKLHATGTEEERQAAAALRYTQQGGGALPSVELELQRIDDRFSIVNQRHDGTTTTVPGRAFSDFDDLEPFEPESSWHSSELPNYSGELIVYALLDLGDGVQPDASERASMRAARTLLCDALPADHDFRIVTHRGFTLDVSRLDLTSFGP